MAALRPVACDRAERQYTPSAQTIAGEAEEEDSCVS